MFERYIESARRTIFFARYEAAQLGSSEIVPEHILLGLFGDGLTWAREVISSVSAQQIRDEILAYLAQHEKQSPRAELSLSQDSQNVLAAAEEEAKRLAHRRVSNHHILLGLLRIENCFAAQVLRRNGLSIDYLREQMRTVQKATGEPAPQTTNAEADLSPADRKLYELEVRLLELFRLNDHQGALKLVDDAIADPSLDRNRMMWSLIPIASVIARTIGDFDLARRYCEQRVACNPNDAMALYKLADCLDLQGEAQRARKVACESYELSLARSGVQGEGLAELIENRFPGIKLGA